MQFQQLAQEYMAERANGKHSTLKSYNAILNAHLFPAFGHKDAGEITRQDIKQLQTELLDKGLTGSRVNTICRLLRSILGEAHRNNVIALDPSKSVKKVRQSKTKIEPFTDDELTAIFSVLDPHYVPLFQTLLLTGMRPNEAFALTWNDIDFERKTINIDKGSVSGHVDSPKTESSERVIPLVDKLAAILEPLRLPTGLVFLNHRGTEIKSAMERVWERACVKAGVKYRCLYTLRHGFATRAIMEGINIVYVSKILGHSNASTTLQFYARWIDSAAHEQNFREVMG